MYVCFCIYLDKFSICTRIHSACMFVCVYVCMCVCMYVCGLLIYDVKKALTALAVNTKNTNYTYMLYIYICVCVCVCVCVIYIYIYIYIVCIYTHIYMYIYTYNLCITCVVCVYVHKYIIITLIYDAEKALAALTMAMSMYMVHVYVHCPWPWWCCAMCMYPYHSFRDLDGQVQRQPTPAWSVCPRLPRIARSTPPYLRTMHIHVPHVSPKKTIRRNFFHKYCNNGALPCTMNTIPEGSPLGSHDLVNSHMPSLQRQK
jgi:hypothetical protein